MICHLCPKPAGWICGDIDRPMCEEHAHYGVKVRDGSSVAECCAPVASEDAAHFDAVAYTQSPLDVTAVVREALRFDPPSAAADVLRAYLALHEGKEGQHWIYAAIGRMVQGDPEAEVMADFGWVQSATLDAAHAHVVALSAERDALRAKLELAVKAVDHARAHVTEAAKCVNEPESFRWLNAIDEALAKGPRIT